MSFRAFPDTESESDAQLNQRSENGVLSCFADLILICLATDLIQNEKYSNQTSQKFKQLCHIQHIESKQFPSGYLRQFPRLEPGFWDEVDNSTQVLISIDFLKKNMIFQRREAGIFNFGILHATRKCANECLQCKSNLKHIHDVRGWISKKRFAESASHPSGLR